MANTTPISSATDLLARYAAGQRVFSYATLSDSDLRYATLSHADLRYATLSHANLRYATLSHANLRGSNLSGANLRGSDLRGSDLRGSDLRGSDLRGSDLSGSDLSHATLRGSDLSDANLSGSDLRDATLPVGSHDVIAELLRRAAGNDARKRAIAGLVLIARDWCWNHFGTLARAEWTAGERAWVVAALEPWPVFAPFLRRYGFVDGARMVGAEEQRKGEGNT